LLAAAGAVGGGQLVWSLIQPQVWQTAVATDTTMYRKYLGRMWIWDWWASNETPPITWDWHQMPLEIAWALVLTAGLVSIICGFLPRRLVQTPRQTHRDK